MEDLSSVTGKERISIGQKLMPLQRFIKVTTFGFSNNQQVLSIN